MILYSIDILEYALSTDLINIRSALIINQHANQMKKYAYTWIELDKSKLMAPSLALKS